MATCPRPPCPLEVKLKQLYGPLFLSLWEVLIPVKLKQFEGHHRPKFPLQLKTGLATEVSEVWMHAAWLDDSSRMLFHLALGKRMHDEICNLRTCKNHSDTAYITASVARPPGLLSAT